MLLLVGYKELRVQTCAITHMLVLRIIITIAVAAGCMPVAAKTSKYLSLLLESFLDERELVELLLANGRVFRR